MDASRDGRGSDAAADVSAAFWCGSYTPEHGHGVGIGVLGADADRVVRRHVPIAPADSPSWVATHPRLPLLYAVGEFTQTVRAYRRTQGGLAPLGGPKRAGEAVCHLALDPEGRYAVASCWGDGQVICYELDDEGVIRSRRVADAASDPHGGDGRVSRAHEALVLPDGRVVTTDLGYDLVRFWRFEPGRGLGVDGEVVLPRGCGPRHLALHPSGRLYVLTELSSELCILVPDADGRYTLAGVTAAGETPVSADDKGAEVSVSADGAFVHTTIRGSDRLCTLAVRDGGARLEPVGDRSCGGANPRHHLERGDRLYVAAQDGDQVVTFGLDAETGLPGEPLGRIPVGSPSCIVPL